MGKDSNDEDEYYNEEEADSDNEKNELFWKTEDEGDDQIDQAEE